LNQIVSAFYSEKVDADYLGVNYVTRDGICARRHEFLGPAPYVAGFRFSAKAQKARVEWWDATTRVKWIGKEVWTNEVYFDETVGGWVSRPRGDYSRNLDVSEYLGL